MVPTEDISCPCCGLSADTFFAETETGVSGYRCLCCGCTFIVLMKGAVPDTREEGDHAKDCWPNRNPLPVGDRWDYKRLLTWSHKTWY